MPSEAHLIQTHEILVWLTFGLAYVIFVRASLPHKFNPAISFHQPIEVAGARRPRMTEVAFDLCTRAKESYEQVVPAYDAIFLVTSSSYRDINDYIIEIPP